MNVLAPDGDLAWLLLELGGGACLALGWLLRVLGQDRGSRGLLIVGVAMIAALILYANLPGIHQRAG